MVRILEPAHEQHELVPADASGHVILPHTFVYGLSLIHISGCTAGQVNPLYLTPGAADSPYLQLPVLKDRVDADGLMTSRIQLFKDCLLYTSDIPCSFLNFTIFFPTVFFIAVPPGTIL